MSDKKVDKKLSPQTLATGLPVHIPRLRKNGIIKDLLSETRCRVYVGSLTITCEASELTILSPSVAPSTRPSQIGIPKVTAPPTTLDLHGHRVHEALQKLDAWLDRSVLAGNSRLKVIHGFGSGKIQKAVHDHLSTLRAVASFRINPFNPGETDVFL